MCETESENTELVFGLERIPVGEFERHLFDRLDVFVKLGEQLGLGELLKLRSFADMKKANHTLQREGK